MPRPKPPSPVEVDQFPLTAQDRKRLGVSLGFELLPPDCADLVGELLANHLKAGRALRGREKGTTAGGVEAVIEKARNALEPFTAMDSGIDADTFRRLRPLAGPFLAAADERLRELQGMPRVYPERELLRETCCRLRMIFEGYAAPDFKADLSARRRFAFDALTAAGIELPSIDDAHLKRLDEFLDASPQQPI